MPPTSLRFGLIGCGGQGRLLAAALASLPDAELVACSDPSTAALAALGGPDVARFTEYELMLRSSDLDAVLIATPHHALAAATLAGIQTGHHAFCEKPLALSAAQAQPVVQAAGAARVNLMVGYIQRFVPLRRKLKNLLDQGVLGELKCVVAGKSGPPLEGWQRSRANGGGELFWVGSHLLDQLHWLLGRRVERVYAEVERAPGDDGTDLTTVATLRFAGGLLAHLDCSQLSPNIYDYVEVVGTEGSGRADWRPEYRLRVHAPRWPEFATPTVVAEEPHALEQECIAELREFVCSIREGRPPAVTGADGLHVLEVLDAIVQSAESGQPVTLDSTVGAGA